MQSAESMRQMGKTPFDNVVGDLQPIQKVFIKGEEDGVPVELGKYEDKYHWTQSLNDIHIRFEVAEGLRAKDLTIDIGRQKLRVLVWNPEEKRNDVIINGELHQVIDVDESTWDKDDTKIEIILRKLTRNFWPCAIVGSSIIDVEQITDLRWGIDRRKKSELEPLYKLYEWQFQRNKKIEEKEKKKREENLSKKNKKDIPAMDQLD